MPGDPQRHPLAHVDQGNEPRFDSLYVMQKLGRKIVARYSSKVRDDLLSNFQAKSPAPHANRILNLWNQGKCMAICLSAKEEQIETYRSEPYVYAQMIAGKDAPCFGEAKNSWLTGTAAWTFVSVVEGLFGIKADFKGLKVDACIPKS